MPLVLAALCSVSWALEIKRGEITWTLSGNPTHGTYANDDPWVVGPVTITNISPKSTLIDGRTMHGSTINPNSAPFPLHGFDSALGGGTGFRTNLNVGRPGGNEISVGNPLVVPVGSSLVSSNSHPTAGNRPQIRDISILTVVASPPVPGSFRPPYCGTDKTHRWNTGSLNYGILSNLAPVAGAKTPEQMAGSFARPWFELGTQTIGRFFHPQNHQPEYGRDMGALIGEALLVLNLDYSPAQKRTLYIRLVQWGIDIYGCAVSGGKWDANGGHNCSRKGGLVLAALALNDPNIKAYADRAQKLIFAEDQQTWYVTQADVGRPLYQGDGRRREEYIQEDVGMAEWGEKHALNPTRDGRNWSTLYRDTVFMGQAGQTLAMHLITGAREAWNWPPYFDYFDRAWPVLGDRVSGFKQNMWAAYRNTNPPSVSLPPSIGEPGMEMAAVPSLDPDGGVFSGPVTVTLATATSGAAIHFTLDGSTPSSSSPLYTGPVNVASSAVIKAIAVKAGMLDSGVRSASFEIGDGAMVSSLNWRNFSFPEMSETFVVGFNMEAGSVPIDGVAGLSGSPASAYGDLACILRFAPDGRIEARNGGIYQAYSPLNYQAGVSYRAVILVELTLKRYSVAMVSPDGTRTTIAIQWQFRSEQANAASLANLGIFSSQGEFTLTDFRINDPGDIQVYPARPQGVVIEK